MKQIFIWSICISVLLFNCTPKLRKLGKESVTISIEIPKNNLNPNKNKNNRKSKEEVAQQAKIYSMKSPPVYYDNKRIFIRSIDNKNALLKVDYNLNQGYLLGNENKVSIKKETEQLIKDEVRKTVETKIIPTPIPIQYSKFHFEHISDFTANDLGEVYAMVLGKTNKAKNDSNIKPEKAEEKKQKDHKKNAKDKKVTEPDEFKKYIYKFDAQGNHIQIIGKEGVNGLPFSDNEALFYMSCDSLNQLYLITKGYDSNKNNSDPFYNLYRYDNGGKRNLFIEQFELYLPRKEGYHSLLENMALSRLDQKLLIMSSFYPKRKNRSKGINLRSKAMYLIDINVSPPKIEEIKTLDLENEKNYSLFGVTDTNKIYLIKPTEENQVDRLKSLYHFRIFNKKGRELHSKQLLIENNAHDIWRWLILGKKGEVVSFTENENGIFCSFYR